MTTPEPRVPADPLEMARNAAAFVGRVAEAQASDDPDVQIQAFIARAGKQAMDNSVMAGMMALVSIAGDLRRMAEPADLTAVSDRLGDLYAKHYDQIDGSERDTLSKARQILESLIETG